MFRCVVALFSLVVIWQNYVNFCSALNVTILHTNDIHARFVPFDGRMKPCDAKSDPATCYGGAARRLTAVKKIRSQYKNVFLLDGGDQFQGTLWYTVLKWKPIAQLVNMFGYDAMAFGNHEFDDGLYKTDEKREEIGLAPYLRAVRSPFVCTNIRTENSEIDRFYKRYHILEAQGQKIGVIGYVTPETAAISHPGNQVKFLDEIEALSKQADDLKKRGVDKLIAIGHSGYEMDKKICAKVPGLDIVVGGHTNTFLYSGPEPTKQTAEGPYPTAIENVEGTKCLVVQDYAFGKYLGFLQVEFDEKGAVKSWNGNPILINSSFAEDASVVQMLEPHKRIIDEFQKSIIGKTAVALEGRRKCRKEECNFGNLVTDAMIYSYLKKHWMEVDSGSSNQQQQHAQEWAPSAIALLSAGTFKDFETDAWTNLTMADMYNTLPYANTVELIRLKGKHILEALERSVEDLEKNYDDPHGKFLQVAGLRVEYDMSQPNGHRVHKVMVKCSDCPQPTYSPLVHDRAYNVVTISFLKKGGDGYSMIADNLLYADGLETLDIDVVADYIRQRSPIAIGVEGRIKFYNSTTDICSSGAVSALGPDENHRFIIFKFGASLAASLLLLFYYYYSALSR